MISRFGAGAAYLLQGFNLLKHPKILPFVVFPIAINVALFYFGFNYLNDIFEGWLASFSARIPEWLGFIEGVLVWLFRIVLLLLFAFSFTFFANFIGSPFYGLMAERVEALKNPGTEFPPFNLQELLAIVPRSLLRELQKLFYYLARAIPLILLSALSLVITPLATLTPVIWFVFGAYMLTLQYVDYAYDNHKIAFRTLASDLRRDRVTSLGFGSACTLAVMVPVLNILAVPAAVCGGTVYFVAKKPDGLPGG